MAAVGSVTTIFVLILIKEGINNNPTCMKNLPVPIPVELFVVSTKVLQTIKVKLQKCLRIKYLSYIVSYFLYLLNHFIVIYMLIFLNNKECIWKFSFSFLFKVIAGTVISHYTKINEKFDVEVVGHIPVG